MPIVYRIENDEKQGPYRSNYLLDKYGDKFHWDRDHPPDYEDGCKSKSAKCAFESIDLLNEWFGEYLDELLENGFYLMRVEVQIYKYSISGRQCFFEEKNVINRYCIQAEVA